MPNVADLQKVKGLSFFSEVKSELSKVVWPTKEETIRLTGIVIIISIVVGVFIGSLDFIFTNIAGLIIR
jgi:preprotein translocase subunit SecE